VDRSENKPSRYLGTFRSYLVGGSVLSGLAGVLGLMPVMFAPTMFDAAVTANNPVLWFTFVAVLSFPVICFLAPVGSYIAYRNGRMRLAAIALLTPFAVAAALAVFWFLIEKYCGGNFTC